jgi:hypothetical protein
MQFANAWLSDVLLVLHTVTCKQPQSVLQVEVRQG